MFKRSTLYAIRCYIDYFSTAAIEIFLLKNYDDLTNSSVDPFANNAWIRAVKYDSSCFLLWKYSAREE